MSYERILAGPLAGLRALIGLLYGAWLLIWVVLGVAAAALIFFWVLDRLGEL